MDYTKWSKDKKNQDKVAQKFFKDNKPRHKGLAVFMAGVPGAGKTELATRLVEESNNDLIPIEHDYLVEYIPGYKPENYYEFRNAGSHLVTKIFEDCVKESYSFIFDGTLSHKQGQQNIAKCLKKGYTVVVIYLLQDAKIAWKLTEARKLQQKRFIKKSGFINTCNRINDNLLAIFRNNKNNNNFMFYVIDKRGEIGEVNAKTVLHSPLSGNQDEQVEKILHTKYNVDSISER